MDIEHAWKQGLKRGKPMYPTNGRLPSPYSIRLKDERVTRRVYEDWNRLETNGSDDPSDWSSVPWVLVIKGEITTLSEDDCNQITTLAQSYEEACSQH